MLRPYRKVKAQGSEIFLSFDDGPCSDLTPQVLDILDEFEAKASFFVIGKQAQKYPQLLKEIQKRGHGLGDHSLDHAYSHFFKKEEHLKSWITQSQSDLADMLGEKPIGFRSPAGVVTPPLMRAIQELDVSWIHWNRRFFDSNIPLNWMSSVQRYSAGDILLLHDRQKSWLQLNFLKNLRKLLRSLQGSGFEFSAIKGDTPFYGI